jgi:hypothetical protein
VPDASQQPIIQPMNLAHGLRIIASLRIASLMMLPSGLSVTGIETAVGRICDAAYSRYH